ncbi:secreted protein containing PKD domain [Flavobacterium anhuiense]|uniref:Secreted protein containing PKD domain n=1 Tax=Flavobacterium anhuiense TaxID=459526 RepID=A0A444W1F1_9FLAO|nr:T9SS type B sorting domain-containing protein [Flavobacterium anhuiense]RYJ39594.1 secreted protein containing PKD domain [Flavobacterium anhuiense]
MKHKLLFIVLLFTRFAFSQQEAGNWYFGRNAGIKFHPDGSVTTLTDGQLNTDEGCASLSNSNGDLLFYTDGVTIWNRNHQVMLNGADLMGHSSSTQSATIVPKPGYSNLFYVFTLDYEVHPNGFRYSIVDINLDGGLGAVTSDKNVLIYTPSDEKLSIVKHKNGVDFWVVTHGWNSNTFYSYLLSSSGLSASPVTSNVGLFVGGSKENVWGYMKISPDGSKLAICHALQNFELLDFDNATGLVSNPLVLRTGDGMYSVEFSPNSAVLYLSVTNPSPYKVIQYDLTSSNIVGSAFTTLIPSIFPCALQLGPNGKIYIAEYGKLKLGVINNPNTTGVGCDLQMDAVDLAGRMCNMGLPPFVSSFFFNPEIQLTNSCSNQNTQFTLIDAQNITSANWSFGDGNRSTDLSPTHTYATAGTYTVSVTATGTRGSVVKTRDVIISAVPTATKPQDLLICDANNDGLHTFDLRTQDTAVLNGQDPNLFTVNYFANNVAIASPGSYINTVPYQKETITAEVANKVNGECKSSTAFNIDVFDIPLPNLPTVIPNLTSCDNSSVGTDTDGKVIFDLTLRATAILNGQSSSQFVISYFKDAALTQAIASPNAYQNTIASETIFIKVVNKDNPDCKAATSFKLEVFALPLITSVVNLKQCDDDIDGFSVFNLEEAIVKITSNSANETITFYKTLADAQNNSNPILNPTTYRNQTVSTDKVYVRVENINDCYRIAELNLIVSTTQIPSTYSKVFVQCDDAVLGTNKDGVAAFDFSSVTTEIKAIFPSGQLLGISYYQNLEDALAEKNAISDISNYRNTSSPNSQKIFIRVDSRLNNDCLGLGGYITLRVEPVPVPQNLKKIHCDDDQDGLYGFDTSTIERELLNGLTNVTVSYLDQNNNPLSSPLPNPFSTGSQIVKVILTNNTATACSFNSTITFVVDDLPEVFAIDPVLTTVCDDESDPVKQDGKYAFDTSSFEAALLGGQTGMIVKYYDANNNLLASPLPNPFLTSSQNVKVEVINPNSTTCSAATFINFIVNPVPKINLKGEELVCSNLPTFTKQIDAGLLDLSLVNNYSYAWFFNGILISDQTSYSLTVNKEGTFTVQVTDKQTNCSRIRTIKVSASDIASNIIAVVDQSNTISVSATGNGDYVYALDDQNGDYQTGNTFENVHAGIHTVYIKDLNGCGTVPKEVPVFGIPNFFTPNHDSYNDYWNIEGVDPVSNSKTTIEIFDRYGKLLKQITPLGQGWDGTYLGSQMPADDYWYVIKLEDNRIFKGHFALKR